MCSCSSLALTSAFLARGKLPLPDPHQAEAEPGLVPAVCGGDAAGAGGVDGSRGVSLPCLPRDLLQQLLLHCQAAGDEDVQAGMARPSGLGRQAHSAWPRGRREPFAAACCFFFFLFPAANRPEERVASTLWEAGRCYLAARLLVAEQAPHTCSAVRFFQRALSQPGGTGGGFVSQARKARTPTAW